MTQPQSRLLRRIVGPVRRLHGVDLSEPERWSRISEVLEAALADDYLILPSDLDQRILGKATIVTKYSRDVGDVRQYLVSSSGQMSLPAAARHRWDLDDGGPVDVIDLGFAVLTLPRGEGRRLLNDLVSREDHAAFVRSLDDDPELATT